MGASTWSDKAGQPCVECGRPAPASTPGPDGSAALGWLNDEDEKGRGRNFLCPDCQTPENVTKWYPEQLEHTEDQP